MPTVNLSTGSVHYLEQGQGTPLILLHANPGDSLDFAAVIPTLANHYRVLALDWPGYGKSMLPPQPEKADCLLFYHVLQEFIAALGLRRVLLVGCSFGGSIAVRLAADQPEKVAGLVLIAPGGFTPHNRISLGFCRLQGSVMALSPPLWASQYLKVRNSVTRAILKRAATAQRLPGRITINRAIWRSFTRPENDLRTLARRVQCPALLLFGRYDPAIQAKKDGEEAQRCMPHAQRHILPCGHIAQAELPELFLQKVIPFLQQCEASKLK